MDAESPRLVAIHQSFLQPLLIFGVDRELFVITSVISAALVFSLGNAYIAIIGIALWLSMLPVLQALAKSDPQMARVYVRHARYAAYFPACAEIAAPSRARFDWG